MAAVKVTKFLGTCIAACVATVSLTALQLNTNEEFTWAGALQDLPRWLNTAPNPWLLLTSLTTAATGFLGAWAAIAQLRAPEAQSEESAAQRHDEAVAKVSENTAITDEARAFAAEEAQRRAADEDAAREERGKLRKGLDSLTDKLHPIAQADLLDPEADPALIQQYDSVLRIAKERNVAFTQQEAANIAQLARKAEKSNRPADEEIVRLIEQGEYRKAARRKVELAKARGEEARREVELAKARGEEEARREEAQELREAATLTLPFAPGEAKEYLEEATKLDPGHFWSWIELGRLRADYDGLQAARDCFQIALQHVSNDRDRMVIHGEFGDMLLTEGELSGAREEYVAALRLNQVLAEREPGNSEWQRDLSVSYNKLGEIEVTAGNLAKAREQFEAARDIADTLATREPGNSEWQRDLSVSYDKLGEIEVTAGNLAKAREQFEAARDIADTLATREPGNSQWQRDLSASYNKLGEIEVTAGNLPKAREHFEADLAIAFKLAESEPGNSEWQRDLSVSYIKLGDIEVTAGNLAKAREQFEAARNIADTLATREPGNSEWQRDLFVSNGKLGALLLKEGEPSKARTKFEESRRIVAALVKAWPDHPGFARDLAIVQDILDSLDGNPPGED